VLRGAGAALALPWLEALDGRGPRPARAQAAPRRFVAVFSSNGVIQEAWRPTGAETAFELGPSLAPLLPHKSDVVVVQGLTLRCKGAVHPAAMSAWLTGTPADSTFVRGPGNAGWATGPSVDQVIAAEIAKAGRTRFRSLELGVKTESGSDLGGYRMIFSGPSQPIPPENSPLGAFSRLFASVGARPGDTAATERLLAQRRSILDAVKGEYARVQARVGAEDRARLEAHLASVREIEADLLAVGSAAPAPACGKPAVTDAADIPAIAKLHMDIIAAALACDLVRVASLQFMRSGAQNTYPWIGVDDKHHDLGHRPDGDTAARDKLVKIETWYAAQVAYLIARLKERSLLDSTLVLWGNELGVGNTHDTKNAPFVLAGRAGGRLRTGRFVKHPGASHNNLLVSVLNAFDVPATTFGLPEWCQGPLPGLVA
jgi:hypothetical protein